MNLRDGLRPQQQRRVAVPRDEPLVAVSEAVHFRDGVAVMKLGDEAADDVIEAGTEAAAGHDRRGGFCGVEEEVLARAGGFEAELRAGFDRAFLDVQRVIEEHAIFIGAEIDLDAADVAQRRDDLTRP